MNIDDIKKANEEAGGFWFSPGTMRCFKSRIHRRVYECADGLFLFVSSEKPPFDGGYRRYTVREFDPKFPREIENHGEFSEYETAQQAHAAARAYMKATKKTLR